MGGQVANNEKYLKTKASTLPDNGKKLKESIRNYQMQELNLVKTLQHAKENIEPLENGKVIVSDEKKLELMKNKKRILSQKYGMAPQASKNQIMDEIRSLNSEITKLEKIVLTKNPNFKPVSKTSSTALTDINSPREVVVLDEVPTLNQNAQSAFNLWSGFNQDSRLL